MQSVVHQSSRQSSSQMDGQEIQHEDSESMPLPPLTEKEVQSYKTSLAAMQEHCLS